VANALKLLKKTADDMAWPEDIQILMIAGYIAQTKPDLDQDKFTNATTDYSVASGLGTEYITALLCKMVEDLEKVKDAKKWKDFLAETVAAFEAEMKASQPQDPMLPFPEPDGDTSTVPGAPSQTQTPSSTSPATPMSSSTPPTISAPTPTSPAPAVAEKPKFRTIEIQAAAPQATYAKAAAVLKSGKQLPDRLLGEILFQFVATSPEDPKVKASIDVVNCNPAAQVDPYMMDGTDFAASGKPGFDLAETFVFHYKDVEYKVKVVPG